ncbi:tyrosine protein kinase [Floricoccus tropicus]|uniref:Capsular polysaccharide biosynthesis protein CpsC n=1 Tax=Floricoccus tropicus TaxID=1859473 RepID=A0A1E8GK75_9LACT|nr:Wzz/FepE/Etk N-terminal domain-containing protein [Floricoccus tropicus]OFI48587.1 tyrosine protein kinase [Floricoccus tropicus]
MEETVSVNDIFQILKKRAYLIIISMLIGLGVAGFLTFFVMTPKYSSESQLIVTLPQDDRQSNNANDVNGNLQMINTYKSLITGDLVINQVKDRMASDYGINMTQDELRKAIKVNQTQNSLMFAINATTDNASKSEEIANLTAEVFQENAKDVMNVDKISIISKATANMNPVSPDPKKNLVIGLVAGMIVGVGLALLFEQFDRTIKDSKFITDNLAFTLLGTVPEMSSKEIADTNRGVQIERESHSIEKEDTQISKNSEETASSDTNKRRRRSRV